MTFESEFLRRPVQDSRRVIEFVIDLERLRIVGKPRRIFDVINVVTEPLQPDEIMDVLPDHARDRHRTHEAHHDNFLFLHLSAVAKG